IETKTREKRTLQKAKRNIANAAGIGEEAPSIKANPPPIQEAMVIEGIIFKGVDTAKGIAPSVIPKEPIKVAGIEFPFSALENFLGKNNVDNDNPIVAAIIPIQHAAIGA